MKAINAVILTAASISLGGCAMAPSAADLQAQQHYQDTIPTCSSPKECEVKWSAARNWVLNNCGFRIEKMEPDYIETYKSGDSSDTNLYCRVTKSAVSETEYRIELAAGANNFLMYMGSAHTALLQGFNDAVNQSWHGSP
ncbi:MAG: hypothetical protein U1F09_13050 [Steroidobacteraceae bacterium]